jgi:hypothetical protein
LETLVRDRLFDEPFAQWARALGANALRVFGMWNVTGFDPRQFSSYYDMLDYGCDWLADNGLRLHFVAFTDQVPGSSVLMSGDEQNAHAQKCAEVLRRHDNVLLEVCNEDWKNGGISGRFPREWFAGVLTTRSSWEDGNTPEEAGSVLDFTTEHTPRGDGWQRKSKNLLETSRQGLGAYPPTNKPAIGGEPERLQNATPRQYADYMAVAELFGSGACLHGDGATLQRCRIPDDRSMPNAVAALWADSAPPELAGAGDYTRGGLGSCPLVHRDRYDDDGREVDASGALRTFAMLAGGRATAVVVDPGPAWQLETTGGWRAQRQYGPHGQLIDLVR